VTVARATSASPFYFKSVTVDIDNVRQEFKDGGIRENNPTIAAWSEYQSLFGGDEGSSTPSLLLSVGSGQVQSSQQSFNSVWPGPYGQLRVAKVAAETFAVLKNLLVKYTEGESRHLDMRNLARGEHSWYKRLNVDLKDEKIPLDDWVSGVWLDPNSNTGAAKSVPGGKTLSKIERYTEQYLDIHGFGFEVPNQHEILPKDKLKQVAKKLVLFRRAREFAASHGTEEDRLRYETFMRPRVTTE
jgi:hypothetical protein